MLIRKLGSDAEDALYSTYLMLNNRPHRITRVRYDTIHTIDITTGSSAEYSAEVLRGWKDLKYPRLGYRNFPNGAWGWVERHSRSYSRGLNTSNTVIKATALTDYHWDNLTNLVSQEAADWLHRDVDRDEQEWTDIAMKAVFQPEWDGKKELADMLAGKTCKWIPSPRYLIERSPSYNRFDVYVDRQIVGSVTKEAEVLGPASNQSLIENMLRRYAS